MRCPTCNGRLRYFGIISETGVVVCPAEACDYAADVPDEVAKAIAEVARPAALAARQAAWRKAGQAVVDGWGDDSIRRPGGSDV